ncbi:MAG: MoxR family ATPase [Defluviitaleaceae bacterium]|nr:MoxR family ATPase [Defluviitaleaceae bacterium]MCL2836263.1 MoxR family ATPase [Defluviitaleaceae bacterium]
MDFAKNLSAIRENIERVIVGKTAEVETALAALLAGGHVLLEDAPGTGKTMLAKTMARSLDVGFGRVQFTPDLLPSDIIGINLYNPKNVEFTLKKGPVFTNILLADEINRATPRTQSALLESMEERQVSIDGVTHKLEPPYFVIATQNPIETQGTFPLPEAQLDRFLAKLSLGYPSGEETVRILQGQGGAGVLDGLKAVIGGDELHMMMAHVKKIYMSADLARYIVELTEATRSHPHVALGVSVRGSMALMNMSKAWAAIRGRGYVIPDDVQALAERVFVHRMILRGGLKNNGGEVLAEILAKVKPPVENWDKRT